jgi:hypothetical protein
VRSGLEEVNQRLLDALRVPYVYEGFRIPFIQPVKPRNYTPDFGLLHNGIIVETKGRFETADRQKHLLVQAQHPDLDIRFVFSNPNTRISKQSTTTYGEWCVHKGFKYAAKTIPQAWLDEPTNWRSLDAVKDLLRQAEKKAKEKK